jgi:nitrite reductase (NADH) large subunit
MMLEDEGAGGYKKLVMRGDSLAGAVLFGDTTDALSHLDMIRSGADISPWRAVLTFGPALGLPQAA